MSRDLPVIEREIQCGPDGPMPGTLGTLLRFNYNESLIEELKELPSRERYWTGSAWWVAGQHHDYAVTLLLHHYAQIMFIGVDGESDYIMDRSGAVIEQGGLFD